MLVFPKTIAVATVLILSSASFADTALTENGGDTFISGPAVTQTPNTSGDTFVAARTAVADGKVQGDLHVSGFDVKVTADAAQDLYAAGASVVVSGNVAEDLSIAGFSVRTENSAETQGNLRVMGNSVSLEGPVAGAASIMAQDVILNAPIDGDVRVLAKTLTFGPNAVVSGTLTYTTKSEITVPERVAPSERVVFKRSSGAIDWDAYRDVSPEFLVFPVFASLFSGLFISLLFFMAIGALMLGFMPKRLKSMRDSIAKAPAQSFLLGVIGLSILFGMVPITGLTIIGLPLVPIIALAIITVWILGYALGAYSVAMRIWEGFGGDPDPSNLTRILVFAGAIICVALLNFIPFVGWVANYSLVLLGIGALTRSVFNYALGNPGQAFDIDMKPIDD